MNQPVPQNLLGSGLTSETPLVQFGSITADNLIGHSPGYNFEGWVVTYPQSSPLVFGPSGVDTSPNSLTCTVVGIQDAATASWLEIFQSCK